MASIFQHFRKLDFTKSLLRPIQCSVVGLRTINDPVVINNHQASEQLCFDDGRELFTSKTTRDILRSIFVLKLCSYDAVAKNSMVVRNLVFCILLLPRRVHNSLDLGCRLPSSLSFGVLRHSRSAVFKTQHDDSNIKK